MPGMPGAPGPCMPSVKSAFSAALTANFPAPDLPVAFSKVFYNIQNSYIASMGIYVAPINGTYVFSFHLTVSQRVLKVGLFHNFDPILKTTDTSSLGTLSHSLVLHLSEGDGVWLQVKDSSTNGMITGEESSSIFSGYLLYPDICDGLTLDLGLGVGRDFKGLPEGVLGPGVGTGPVPPATPDGSKFMGPFTWDKPTAAPTTKP
ncbi:hypothetical protein WMY93_030616 [Mugilogobius chulae]|uniref:C1q domain-containing protein n=1 Tax=Mugilogobius chulae TaxID=88201 RepID=A0AAW0MVW4_9GOBI